MNLVIFGVGVIILILIVVDGEIVVWLIMVMCLIIDYCIVDGMNGVKFMVDFKNLMENLFGLFIWFCRF